MMSDRFMRPPSSKESNDDERCSSGFSIRYNGTTVHSTTARHCDSNVFRSRNYSTSDLTKYKLGLTHAWANNGQARIMTAPGGVRMWDGPYDDGNFTKVVGSLRDPTGGASICTSGGNSGVHCNLRIYDMSVPDDDGYGSELNVLARQNISGSAFAAAPGDSGGAVFVPTSDGKVGAMGMIQNGRYQYTTSCTGLPLRDIPPSNDCFDAIGFTSMRTILNDLPNSTLLTG